MPKEHENIEEGDFVITTMSSGRFSVERYQGSVVGEYSSIVGAKKAVSIQIENRSICPNVWFVYDGGDFDNITGEFFQKSTGAKCRG